VRHGMCELTARHGRETAWARHAMCESAFTGSCGPWPPICKVRGSVFLYISCQNHNSQVTEPDQELCKE
jgi:hypothetical protein